MLGKHNALADAIYRQQWCRFRVLGPTADQQPRVIPASFHNALFKIKKKRPLLISTFACLRPFRTPTTIEFIIVTHVYG